MTNNGEIPVNLILKRDTIELKWSTAVDQKSLKKLKKLN